MAEPVGGLVLACLLALARFCPLHTSDAADDLLCVDLGGRRIINKIKVQYVDVRPHITHQHQLRSKEVYATRYT